MPPDQPKSSHRSDQDPDSCPPELLEEPDREGPGLTQIRGLRRQRPGTLRAAMLIGLFVLAALYTIYYTQPLLLPITAALLLNFLLQPLNRLLYRRARLPYAASAGLIMLAFIAAVGGAGYGLSDPALDWLDRAPRSVARIEQKFAEAGGARGGVGEVVQEVSRLIQRIEGLNPMNGAPGEAGGGAADGGGAGGQEEAPEPVPVRESGPGLGSHILGYASAIGQGALTAFILTFFLLASGDTFLRKLEHVLPRLHDKRQAVVIAHQIEHSISTYLVTYTAINICLGLATTGVMWLVGMPNPWLWGAMAALFNFVPYLGPVAVMAILLVAGLLTFDSIPRALAAPGAFFLLNLTEAYGVTPLLLGKQLSLHPVAVLLSIVFWFFMWGVAGAIIAVPLLMVLKIICDHVEPLEPLAEFLSGGTERPQDHPGNG